ncbi:alpha/beta fold hydrolase [Pantoea sp. 18069]|uniref:alpha/beta fold hydrolase n=1 Tax=Pantoea sp. 18069 TaxID=2681415 RepID=UPI001F16DF6A|nr:alpha/beta fold hydrolase [Pantoea sp. 18069]
MLESAPGFLAPATYRWPSLQRSSRLAGAALFAVILVACGGGDGGSAGGGGNAGGGVEPPVDLLASFKQQTLNWQACDPSATQDEDELAQLGERARCALMRVPLDYANPSSAELQIEVLKVAAEQTPRKLGAIVLNPGGPGMDGLSVAPSLSSRLAQGDPQEGGELLQEMSRRYDLVAFSPRGTGRHSPLNCQLNEALVPDDDLIVDPSPENVRKIQHNARVLAQACAATPMSKHIHTEATARDMDLLRGLLGEEKLNYIGYSYGTWLGSWYAGLFPERVGRMLLDSSMDITATLEDAYLAQAQAEQRVIDEVLLPHAASNPDRFGLGTDATALRNRLLAVSARMKQALIQFWDHTESDDLNRNTFAVAAALGLQDLLSHNPQASLQDLQVAMAASSAFDIAQVAEQADILSDMLFTPKEANQLGKQDFVHWSVRCNDTGTMGSHGSDQYWSALAGDFADRNPFAQERYAYNPCLYWSGADKKLPPIAEIRKAGELLMLHSRYDAATPVESAMNTLDELPNTRMIMVRNEYQHMVFPYGTACVDKQVANYFLHGQVPARASAGICAGKPLGEEEDDEDA